MGGQEKKEEEWRRQKVQDEKALVKGLRLAFEEGEAAGCDREVIDHCRRVYSELRVFTSAQWTIRRLAEEQAAQRAAEEAARQKAERAAAKAAEREARRKAAEEKGEDFEESEDESEDENRFYDEEADDDEDKEDPKDVEDGSVQTICAALQRGREAGGHHEVRDFGKAFLKELDLQVYHQYLLQEMTFSASQRSAAELKHVLQQVVAEGLGPPPDTKPRSAQKEIAAQERPGARRFLQEASAGKPKDANRAPAESAEPADVTPEPAESAKPADAPQERTEESADPADVTLEPAESGKSADIAPEPAESAQLADITPEPVESAKPADATPEPESGKPADITPEPAESAKPADAPEPAEAEPAEETTAKSGQDGEDGEAAGDHKAEAGPADAVIKAHTRLAFLEMADAMEARDLPELLRLVPAAEKADVEETEVALGWRLIRELQLAESVKKQNLKEIRLRLEKAREAKVQDEVLHNAGRKLANWEIREGTSQGNAKMLERAIAEGRAAGLTEKQLFSGKHALLKLQVAALVSTEMPEEIRKLLAMAEGMGMPPDSKELEQPKSRLALLELREAIEGTDAKKLQACMDAAKEHRVDGEELEKGSFRLRVLELQEASRDFDAERLREAMQDAKAAGVPKSLFPPAKRKLADLNPEALSEWMLEELEEAVTSLSAEDPSAQLRPILEEAIAAKVNEEDIKPAEEKLAKMELKEAATMTDRFDVERILNTAQVYGWDLSKGSMGALYEAADVNRKNLIMKERKAECKDSLEFAIMSMDLELLRQHIKEAQDLGLDKEVIEKAEAIYQDYA
ncbi:unnamed protein product [Effrenium voratum]|nr:unnamed protein product [Effrenium voratum]